LFDFGIGIAGRVGQVDHHVVDNLVRRIKSEHGQVADIQLRDLMAFFFHLPGFFGHRTANFIADFR